DEKDMEEYYEKIKDVYLKIFHEIGLDVYMTEASGGSFTKTHSHEFQALAENGEDTIFVCETCKLACNKEVICHSALDAESRDGIDSRFRGNDKKIGNDNDGSGMTKCDKCSAELIEKRSIEVGNIFKLGTKFSEALGLNYGDKDGKLKPVIMASYGIGTARTMGAVAEILSDEKGLVWPETIAP
ncbi:MAG: prolyl-tRNA synthetase, partial [Candidatus Berkelbacteria bacterium Licking1014_85]